MSALGDYFNSTDYPSSFLQQYINPTKKDNLGGIDWSKYPAFKGMDLSSGLRNVDLTKSFNTFAPEQAYSYTSPMDQGYSIDGTLADTKAVPETQNWAKELLAFQKESYPFERERMIDQYNLAAQLGQRQLLESYPILSQAGWDATRRNLFASKDYLTFAEGLPSNVQNIMTAKQAQIASAAGAEAERARAMAVQQSAASQFGSLGTERRGRG